MDNKGESTGIVAIVALIIIVAGLVVFFVVFDGKELLSINNDGGEGQNTTTYITTRTSLSRLFHNQIDPVFPTFLDDARNNCIATGGVWKDDRGIIGCWAVPAWDSTQCATSPQIAVLRTICQSIEETLWTCDARNVGCEYE